MEPALFINTVSLEECIAVIKEETIVAEKRWEGNRDESERVLPTILSVLKKTKYTLSDIKHIYIVTGPGGFSSTRVGVTIANTLAYALEIKLTELNEDDVKNWPNCNWKYLEERIQTKIAEPFYNKPANITLK